MPILRKPFYQGLYHPVRKNWTNICRIGIHLVEIMPRGTRVIPGMEPELREIRSMLSSQLNGGFHLSLTSTLPNTIQSLVANDIHFIHSTFFSIWIADCIKG